MHLGLLWKFSTVCDVAHICSCNESAIFSQAIEMRLLVLRLGLIIKLGRSMLFVSQSSRYNHRALLVGMNNGG